MTGIAVVDRKGTLTYAELEERVARAAGRLVELGVRPGDAVLIVAANEHTSVIAYHATVRCGGVAVLTQHSAGASELRAARDATGPKLALLPPPALALADDLPGLPVLAAADLATGQSSPVHEPLAPDPDRPRAIVFTSGTTSTPKAVVHTARSLQGAVACFAAMTAFGPDDRAFLVSPLASITGVTQALEMAPAVGGAVVLESTFDEERTLDLLLDSGGTFYGGPDLVLDRLLSTATRRGVGVPLRGAALGGTMLRPELITTVESFGIRVVRVYGSSEVPWSTGTRPDEPDALRLTDEGTPGPGVELRLSPDGTRELLIRGPHLFAGYLEQDQTDAALDDGWFRTGDEAEIVDGRLRIVGRLKDIASRNGKKISLAEVDLAFTSATGIAGCAAFVVPDDATGERVALAVRSDVDLDVPAVLAAMEAAGLARFKLPEVVVRLSDPLPVTATGKVQRRELSEDVGSVLWRAPRLQA
jgi:acyl-CoA synthetase (AMP-forming)/AMP-acid ligase II